jgi:hypothetical protein
MRKLPAQKKAKAVTVVSLINFFILLVKDWQPVHTPDQLDPRHETSTENIRSVCMIPSLH